ncbi:hypothetical protein Q9966_007085 [Columba livia]|nr:hypothetical protein Q9966_007085 [Columba livia]
MVKPSLWVKLIQVPVWVPGPSSQDMPWPSLWVKLIQVPVWVPRPSSQDMPWTNREAVWKEAFPEGSRSSLPDSGEAAEAMPAAGMPGLPRPGAYQHSSVNEFHTTNSDVVGKNTKGAPNPQRNASVLDPDDTGKICTMSIATAVMSTLLTVVLFCVLMWKVMKAKKKYKIAPSTICSDTCQPYIASSNGNGFLFCICLTTFPPNSSKIQHQLLPVPQHFTGQGTESRTKKQSKAVGNTGRFRGFELPIEETKMESWWDLLYSNGKDTAKG